MSKIIGFKNANHDLSDLVGKTIKSISMTEIDINEDDRDVRQYYHITFSDNRKTILTCDGNNSSQYATACLISEDDYNGLLEDVDD